MKRKTFLTPIRLSKGRTPQVEASRDDVAGALRTDILTLQSFIDLLLSNDVIGSHERRILENQLATAELEQLNALMAQKSTKFAELLRYETSTQEKSVVGPLLDMCRMWVKAEHGVVLSPLRAAATGVVDLRKHPLTPSNRYGVDGGSEIHDAGSVMSEKADDAAVSEGRPGVSPTSSLPPLAPSKTSDSGSVAARDSVTVVETSLAGVGQGGGSQGAYRLAKPLSSSAVTKLATLGINISGEVPLDIDLIISKLSQKARAIERSHNALEIRVKEVAEDKRVALETKTKEIELLKHQLDKKVAECNDAMRQINGSRFSSNTVRSLTNIRDEPMSIDVEKQYVRSIHKGNVMASELRASIDRLEMQHGHDNDFIANFGQIKQGLEKEISTLKKEIKSLKGQKRDVELLLAGSTKTRDEEAKLSTMAIEHLQRQYNDKENECLSLKRQLAKIEENFSAMLNYDSTVQQYVERLRLQLRQQNQDFRDYKKVFNYSHVDRIVLLQDRLLETERLRDHYETQTLVLQQKLSDADGMLKLVNAENSQMLEKLQGSEEWNQLNEDAVAKLGAKLVSLMVDRDKKVGMQKSNHKERMNKINKLAEKEVREREKKRSSMAAEFIKKSEIESFHNVLHELCEKKYSDRRLEQVVLHEEETTRLEEHLNQYLTFAKRYIGTFPDYFYDQHPDLAEQLGVSPTGVVVPPCNASGQCDEDHAVSEDGDMDNMQSVDLKAVEEVEEEECEEEGEDDAE